MGGAAALAAGVGGAAEGEPALPDDGTEQPSLGPQPFSLLTGVTSTLPLVLFIAFCLCTGVSKSLFSAWQCVEIEVDAAGGPDDAT